MRPSARPTPRSPSAGCAQPACRLERCCLTAHPSPALRLAVPNMAAITHIKTGCGRLHRGDSHAHRPTATLPPPARRSTTTDASRHHIAITAPGLAACCWPGVGLPAGRHRRLPSSPHHCLTLSFAPAPLSTVSACPPLARWPLYPRCPAVSSPVLLLMAVLVDAAGWPVSHQHSSGSGRSVRRITCPLRIFSHFSTASMGAAVGDTRAKVEREGPVQGRHAPACRRGRQAGSSGVPRSALSQRVRARSARSRADFSTQST